MACEDSVVESIIVSDINNNLITLNNGDTLLARTNNVEDEVLRISTATGALDISLMPGAGIATDADTEYPYGISYNGSTVTWTRIISKDAGNSIDLGTDGGAFLSLTPAVIGNLFKVSGGTDGTTITSGPHNVGLTDRLHFWSDETISVKTFINDPVVEVKLEAAISLAVDNLLTRDGGGLYVPPVPDVTTGFTQLSTGIHRYTNEALTAYDLNLNASALPAIDTEGVLGAKGGATFIQSLLDYAIGEILDPAVGVLSYNLNANRLTYTNEIGVSNNIDLSSASTTYINTSSNSVISMGISGTGGVNNPYLLSSTFTGRLNDLVDVSITPGMIQTNNVLTWTGSRYDLMPVPTGPVTPDNYLKDVKFITNGTDEASLQFVGVGPFAANMVVPMNEVMNSGPGHYISQIALGGAGLDELVFTTVGAGYVLPNLPLSTLTGGLYSFYLGSGIASNEEITSGKIIKINGDALNILQANLLASGGGNFQIDLELGPGNGAIADNAVLKWDTSGSGAAYWGDPVPNSLPVKEHFSITEFGRTASVTTGNGEIFFVVPAYMSGKYLTNFKVTVIGAPATLLEGDLNVGGTDYEFTIAGGSFRSNNTVNVLLTEDMIIYVKVSTPDGAVGLNVVGTVSVS
jgi:hypothetical protein